MSLGISQYAHTGYEVNWLTTSPLRIFVQLRGKIEEMITTRIPVEYVFIVSNWKLLILMHKTETLEQLLNRKKATKCLAKVCHSLVRQVVERCNTA